MTAPTHSYRPGSWFGIFGEHATVLLPPSEKARVVELWAVVDDGAGFAEVLDALISGGLRHLPGFVLVSTSGTETRLVVRGEARAELETDEGTVAVDGSGAAVWAERTVPGVSTLRVRVDEAEADAPRHLISAGVVRVSEVSTPAEAEPAAPVPEVAEPVPADDLADTGPQVAVSQVPPGPIGPEPPGPPTPAEPPVGVPSGPPPPVLPATVATPTGDDDDPTDGGGATRGPDDSRQAAVTRPVARLVFSHGDEVEVDRAVLVGRSPEARRFTSGDQPRLVTVPSPAQEISSTHLEVRPGTGADHGSAVVTDLGSTNGTVLVQPGLAPEDLQPGIAVQLIPGAIIDLGDGVTIQVVNP